MQRILFVDDERSLGQIAERNLRTLDAYESGINIVRVNLDRADPPAEVCEVENPVESFLLTGVDDGDADTA